jgi:hypothetical protein
MIRKSLALLAVVVGVLALSVTPASATQGGGEGHTPIVVCHAVPAADDQPTQGYLRLVVDDDSTKYKGHLEHSKDVIGQSGDEDFECPKPDPEQPDPKVEVVTIDTGVPVCDSETVPTETTTTTTEYVWDSESRKWVAGEPKVVVTEGTRPLTEEEQAALEEECADIGVLPTAPTFTDPTCENDNEASVTLPEVEGVEYAVEGDVEPGASVVVRATAQDGYVLTGEDLWNHTFPAAETDCDGTPPPPNDPPTTTPATLPHTGPVDPMLPLGGLALLGLGTAAMLGSRKIGLN